MHPVGVEPVRGSRERVLVEVPELDIGEGPAGDLLEIRAELTKIGGKSITCNYEMISRGSGEVSATLECVSVLFDLHTRKAVEIDGDLRETLEKNLVSAAEG